VGALELGPMIDDKAVYSRGACRPLNANVFSTFPLALVRQLRSICTQDRAAVAT
jgi:hypothetical protein